MKILFSDNSIFGLVNFREPVFRYFNDQGYDVVLVAPNPVNGEDMARVAPAYAKYIPVQMERTGQNPLGDLMYLWRLFKYIEKKSQTTYSIIRLNRIFMARLLQNCVEYVPLVWLQDSDMRLRIKE